VATSQIIPQTNAERQYLPWTALIAVSIAMAAMVISLGFTYFLPPLAFALVATYFIRARITVSWLHWLLRLVAYGTIAGFNTGNLALFSIETGTFQVICLICLSELVLQCWMKQRDRSSLGVAIFLSGLVFLLGCTTENDILIRFLAPAYMFFAILSFPAFRSAAAVLGKTRLAVVGLRGLALLLALGAGAFVYSLFWTNRQQLTEFGDRFMQNKRVPEQAGVSSNPVLGDSFGATGSPARVLRIVGPISDSHLRGLSFDTYEMGAWHGGLYSAYKKVSPQELQAGAAGPRAQITCFADSAGVVYLPLNSAGLDTSNARAIVSWARESGAGVRILAPPPYQYTVIGGPLEFTQGPFCTPPSAQYQARDLAVPSSVDPAVRALALQIGGKLTRPEEKIQAVTHYLMSHYTYSLTIHPGPGDPVSNFLLHRKSAYCEYFASAATILLRYLDVPTRYVVGYYAHESEGPNVTVVRQWDAHAWAESWVDGLGWVTVDATPGDGRPDQMDHSIPFWTRAWEWLQDESASLRSRLAQLSPLQIAGIVCAVGLGVLFISWLWRKGWRSWLRRRIKKKTFGYSLHDRDLEKMAARFEAFLARSGLSCPADQTWRECVQRASVEDSSTRRPIDIEIALSFIDEYNSARFGEEGYSVNDRLRDLLDLLEEKRPGPIASVGDR
jgi:transglutaminase-like putative cysteine protease